MKNSSFRFFFILTILLIDSFSTIAEDQIQAWSVVTANVPLNDSKSLRASIELQHRSLDEFRSTYRAIYRPSIEYNLSPKLWVAAGYLYMPTYLDGVLSGRSQEEHRPWQQIQYVDTFLGNPASYYFRIEERFIEGKDETQYRARLFAKTSTRIGVKHDYGLTYFDEVFLNLDKNDRGPDSGFDQNRAFVGAYFADAVVRLEIGYLNVISKSYLEERRQTHVLRTALSFKW